MVLWHIQGFPAMPGQKFGPAWFPGLLAAGLVLCGALLVRSGWRSGAELFTWPAWMRQRRAASGVVAVVAGILFYVLAVDRLGFHVTGVVLLALWVRLLGASWRVTLPVAFIASFAIHLAFYKALRVPLPWGMFERWAF